MTSFVSVIIPTLNAADRISGLIERLQAQTIKGAEIYVVDSSSEDGTAELAESLGARVKVIDRASFNHGLTRHEALLDTSSDFVCFLTDDAVPADERYLECLLRPFDDLEVALVSGRQLPKADARRFEQLVRQFNYSDKSNVRTAADIPTLGIKAFFATDVCSAYRRSAYLASGGFPELNMSEDMYMAARFLADGRKVAYAADARVYHSHNLTPSQQYWRNKAIGAFLESHREELADASETGEGMRLVREVSATLLHEKNYRELGAFGLDCLARFAGNRAGRGSVRRSLAEGQTR